MPETGHERTVCLVTCQKLDGLTVDDRPLAEAFESREWSVEVAPWDKPDHDWASYSAVIIRSTWDYHLRAAEFHRWLDRSETQGVRLWNPPGLIRWNVHKDYLRELAETGLPVVSTEILRRGESRDLAELLRARGWAEAVIKPAISATAYRTFRASLETAADHQSELDESVAEADTLIQPFVPEITSAGEISLLYFGGRFSHAVLKQAKVGDFRVQSDFGGTETRFEPNSRHLMQADRIAAEIPQPWLYARIDVVDQGGLLVVMEVELIEPQLFFGGDRGAASRFVAAVEAVYARV